uniref:Cysteine-rich secretory protein n=1 Tax=Hadrurus spadix TaxID=141984 RepID=A0A1W7RAQ5_9SCOR
MTSMIIPILALWIVITGTSAYYDCDEKYTNITLEHTMCKIANESCRFLRKGKTFAAQLLHTHNNIRNSIHRFVGKEYPLATNMELMNWDEELYTIARIHSLQCVEEPDCNLCHQIGDFPVEQNFAVKKFKKSEVDNNGPVKRFQTVIKEWAAELQLYDPSVVSNLTITDGLPVNWINILRATTLFVGCASMNFYSDESGIIKEVYICNYGPAKLTEGEEIYKTGNVSCSNCKDDGICDTEFKRLCVPTDFEMNIRTTSSQNSTRYPWYYRNESYYVGNATNEENSSWEEVTETLMETSIVEENATFVVTEIVPSDETSMEEDIEFLPSDETSVEEDIEFLPSTAPSEENTYLIKSKIRPLVSKMLKYSAKLPKGMLQKQLVTDMKRVIRHLI